jgi:hypothetical protein
VPADLAGDDQRLDRQLDQCEAVLRLDLADPLPPQDAGAVEQHDALDGRILRGLEEGAHARVGGLPRIALLRDDLRHLLAQLACLLLEDGLEQLRLASEVVIQRALRDSGRGRHSID